MYAIRSYYVPVDAVLREEDRYGVLRGDPGAAGPNPDPRQLDAAAGGGRLV